MNRPEARNRPSPLEWVTNKLLEQLGIGTSGIESREAEEVLDLAHGGAFTFPTEVVTEASRISQKK